MSKMFPVLSLLQMRDLGEVRSLDDPVSDMFPEFIIQNPWPTSRTTVTWR